MIQRSWTSVTVRTTSSAKLAQNVWRTSRTMQGLTGALGTNSGMSTLYNIKNIMESRHFIRIVDLSPNQVKMKRKVRTDRFLRDLSILL